MRVQLKHLSLLLACLLVAAGCARRAASTPPPEAVQLHRSIASGAEYLARVCQPDGEFIYRDHLDPDVVYPFRYNELRHAGALYPLGEYSRLYQRDPKIVEAMARAAKFYIKKYVEPVTDTHGKILPGVLGSWTVPEDEGKTGNRVVKLGGVGLGLVGLIETARAAPQAIPLETLRGLGRCLLFMQLADGSFYSKYDPQLGAQDRWDSLYYPGEAALGLAMLYEFDPDPKQKTQWLNAGLKALAYLARTRQNQTDLPADHWYLIALARLMPHYPASDQTVPRHLLLEGGIALGRFILSDPALHGSGTTAVATRLEGLLALFEVLPPEQDALKRKIILAANQEITRLLSVQVQSGALAGGLPHNFDPQTRVTPETDKTAKRSGEVRIDYIQHAISAMMAYDRVRKAIEAKNPAATPIQSDP
jgi:hypothetical protein